MNSPLVGLRVAGTIFGLMCAGQLLRLATQAPITIAGFAVPVGLSAIGFVLMGLLSLWMWRLARSISK